MIKLKRNPFFFTPCSNLKLRSADNLFIFLFFINWNKYVIEKVKLLTERLNNTQEEHIKEDV